MGLPEPTLTFTVPSVHDDTKLDCRLYLPRTAHQSEKKRGAVVAHPYAPLGGCSDDHVVAAVSVEFLRQGYTTCTFNFRGARGSQGHTSWTGKPEVADFASVVGFLAYFLTFEHNEPVQMIFAGYSYGSMVASHTAPPAELLKTFDSAQEGSAAWEVLQRASHLAMLVKLELAAQQEDEASSLEHGTKPHHFGHTLQVGGEETPQDKRRRSGEHRRLSTEIRRSVELVRRFPHIHHKVHKQPTPESSERHHNELPQPEVEAAWLLVSPLLPPSSLIAFSLGRGQQQKEEVQTKLSGHTSLAVYGGSDLFTSASKLRPWAQNMATRPDSRFTYVEVEGAGHFWHEEGAEKKLRIALREWMRRLA